MTVLEEVGAHALNGIIPEHSKQSTVSCQNVYEHFASLIMTFSQEVIGNFGPVRQNLDQSIF